MRNDSLSKEKLAILSIFFGISASLNFFVPGHFRTAIIFIYLLIVPGFLFQLNITPEKTMRLDLGRALLCIPLSIFFIISSGLVLTFAKRSPVPEIDIRYLLYLIVFISLLMTYRLRHAKVQSITFPIPIKGPVVAIAIFLTFLSSSYLVSFYGTNSPLIVSFFIGALFFIFLIRKGSHNVYPWFVWAVSLGVIIHVVVISGMMRPTDNTSELYLVAQVIEQGFWNPNLQRSANAMPSIIFLPTIFYYSAGLDLFTVFKYVIPLISSFIPVILYAGIKEQYGPEVALLSSVLFLSLFNYFSWYSMTAKMVSSGIFLASIVLFLSSRFSGIAANISLVILLGGVALSHYGTTLILIIAFSIGYVLKLLAEGTIHFSPNRSRVLNIGTIALLVSFSISWYFWTASSTIFESIVTIAYNFITSVPRLLSFGGNSYSGEIANTKLPLYLYLIVRQYMALFAAMGMGVLAVLYSSIMKRKLIDYQIIGITMVGLILLIHVSGSAQYGGGRIWVISGFFSLSLAIIGLKWLFSFTEGIGLQFDGDVVISILISLFLLFNAGVAAEVIWDYNPGPSPAIGAPRIAESGQIEEKELLQRTSLSSGEAMSMQWLESRSQPGIYVYADRNARTKLHIIGYFHNSLTIGESRVVNLQSDTDTLPNSYIFLREFNVRYGRFVQPSLHFFPEFFEVAPVVSNKNLVYSNGASRIYLSDV